jgi:hypothetical protein
VDECIKPLVDSIKTRVESAAWLPALFQRLKLKYHQMLSSFAFKFNLRHYNVGGGARRAAARDRQGITLVLFSAQRKHFDGICWLASVCQ